MFAIFGNDEGAQTDPFPPVNNKFARQLCLEVSRRAPELGSLLPAALKHLVSWQLNLIAMFMLAEGASSPHLKARERERLTGSAPALNRRLTGPARSFGRHKQPLFLFLTMQLRARAKQVLRNAHELLHRAREEVTTAGHAHSQAAAAARVAEIRCGELQNELRALSEQVRRAERRANAAERRAEEASKASHERRMQSQAFQQQLEERDRELVEANAAIERAERLAAERLDALEALERSLLGEETTFQPV